MINSTRPTNLWVKIMLFKCIEVMERIKN